jgi:hypothetical protein
LPQGYPQAIAKLQAAINDLEKEKKEIAETLSRAKQASQKIGLRKLAAQARIAPPISYTLSKKKDALAWECLLSCSAP